MESGHRTNRNLEIPGVSVQEKEEDSVKRNGQLTAVLLLTAMVGGLTACGGGNSTETASGTNPMEQQTTAPAETESTKEAAANQEDKITITYWNTNRHDQEYMAPLIEEFNNTNADNIYIDYQIYAENYAQMLDLSFSTDSAPDVFQIPGSEFATIVEKGYAMDIAPFMTDEYKARYGEGAFVEGINMVDGKIYSLPYTASAVRLFYNQDIFERVGVKEPPSSLEEMVEIAKLITEKLSGEGIYGIAGNYKSSAAIYRTVDPVVMVSGGTRGGFDYQSGMYDFTSYKPILEAFGELYEGGYAFPGSESLDIDPLRTQFAAGKIGMYMSLSHAEPGVYVSQFPTDINWNCAYIPAVGGEVKGKQQLWTGGNSFAVNANTEHSEEAWKVMEFLHSDEVMSGYYTAGLGTVMIPSAVEKAEIPESVKKMPALELSDNDRNYPALPTSLKVEGKDYASVFVEVIFGMTDVDKAIEDLNKRYNEAYDKMVEAGADRIVYPNFTTENLDTTK